MFLVQISNLYFYVFDLLLTETTLQELISDSNYVKYDIQKSRNVD